MTTTPADSISRVDAPASTNTDLPLTSFPTLSRIQRSDSVGTTASNQQERALEKRTNTLRDKVNDLIDAMNAVDAMYVRKAGGAQKDGTTGYTADIAMNGHTFTGMRAAVADGEAVRYNEFAALSSYVASTALGSVPIGTILPYGGISAPPGYIIADGCIFYSTGFVRPEGGGMQSYSAYPTTLSWSALADTVNSLRAIFGSMYGGDGNTSFGIPDFRGRSPLGYGAGIGLTPRTSIGIKLGEESHTLSTDEIPAHTHSISLGGSDTDGGTAANGSSPNNSTVSSSVGLGQSHNNMHPIIVTNFIIRYKYA